MFKSILFLTTALCTFLSSDLAYAQGTYIGDGFCIFWDDGSFSANPPSSPEHIIIIDTSSSNTLAEIVIDFDPNTIEIEINGQETDLPIGNHEQIQIYVASTNFDDGLDIYGFPSLARVNANMLDGNDRVEVHGSTRLIANGDAGDDVLMGGSDEDHLTGGSGADVLLGGDGDDLLDGSLDGFTDWLEGEDGADAFVQYLYPATTTIAPSLRTITSLDTTRTAATKLGIREKEYRADFDANEDTIRNAYQDGYIN